MNNKKDYNRFNDTLYKEVKKNFIVGTFYSALLPFFSFFILLGIDRLDKTANYIVPAFWCLTIAIYSFFIHILLKKDKIKGIFQFLTILIFVSLPSLIYLIAHFYMPFGSATYITGPPSYVYLFVIALTGFLFNSKISILSGIFCGIEYFSIYLISAKNLKLVQVSDINFYKDLTSIEFYFFKSLIMVFTGILIGLLAKNTKSLITKILKEEDEKRAIDVLFGQFVSHEIKDKIISEKKDVIGETKEVVVLFSDIRSFTSMSENRDPSELVIQLNEYFDGMVEEINRKNGVIDKFIGDAIMATFGGLIDDNSPCNSALIASENMLKRLDELNKDWKKRNLPELKIGIGLHFGKVLQGTIGSKNRKEFTVIGDTVNAASRIESLCKDLKSEILLSSSVYNELSQEIKRIVEFKDELSVKGKENKLKIYGK